MSFLYGAAGGGVVGVILVFVAGCCWAQIARSIAERDRLREQRLTSLDERLKNHIESDRSQEILAKLEAMEKSRKECHNTLGGKIEVLSAQIMRALETNSGQSKDIENLKTYVGNLREDLQNHGHNNRRPK